MNPSEEEVIQIIETKDGLTPNTKVLHYKGRSLMEDILTAQDVKDLPILVYSVTGKTRGGKSFLLNLMYKYLDQQGNPGWMEGIIPNIFQFKDGVDSMTKGIWMCKRLFRRVFQDGTKVGIMLMDNQGLFDGEVTTGESVAMSGVSTVLSHVQMFNMKEKITTNDLEQVMLHLVPKDVEEDHDEKVCTGSNLMFVVRDFMGGKKHGFGLVNGKKYIDDEQTRGTQEYQCMWDEQRSVFNNIECVLLPHPGIIVTSEEFTKSPRLRELESSFVSEVSKYLEELFSPEKLIPLRGGFTGQKIHETLSKLDGKLADRNLSYYDMFIEHSNRIAMESSVESFKNKLENSGDIYKAKEFMDMTLDTAKFKGQSADEFTSTLRQTLEGVINPKVQIHLVNLYTTATSSGDIIVSHSTIWPKVITDMCLLVGPEPVVKQTKEEIVKEMATVYYSKCALKERSIIKTDMDTATPEQFYNLMADLSQPQTLNGFLDSKIKLCEDFFRTDVSVLSLNDIRRKQLDQFRVDVETLMLSNRYKVTNYFVERYRRTLVNQNVKEQNSTLWPIYENDFNRLRFESESERLHYLQTITKEISDTYYRLFREEVGKRLNDQWSSQDNVAFRHTYEVYKDQNNLNRLISGEFPEYDPFSRQGHFPIWKNEANFLENELNRILNEGYQNRGLNQPQRKKKKKTLKRIEREIRRGIDKITFSTHVNMNL